MKLERISTRPLNAPDALRVRADARGRPLAIWSGRHRLWRRVAAVLDRWRIDDEWYREKPISRLYHDVELEGGAHLTLYHDLVADTWWEQRDAGGPSFTTTWGATSRE